MLLLMPHSHSLAQAIEDRSTVNYSEISNVDNQTVAQDGFKA